MVVAREPEVTAMAVTAPESDDPTRAATTAGFFRERTNKPSFLNTLLFSDGAAEFK